METDYFKKKKQDRKKGVKIFVSESSTDWQLNTLELQQLQPLVMYFGIPN